MVAGNIHCRLVRCFHCSCLRTNSSAIIAYHSYLQLSQSHYIGSSAVLNGFQESNPGLNNILFDFQIQNAMENFFLLEQYQQHQLCTLFFLYGKLTCHGWQYFYLQNLTAVNPPVTLNVILATSEYGSSMLQNLLLVIERHFRR